MAKAKRVFTTTKNTISIVVDGGLVQEVIGLPAGYRARIVDCDIDGTEEKELSKFLYPSGRKVEAVVYILETT